MANIYRLRLLSARTPKSASCLVPDQVSKICGSRWCMTTLAFTRSTSERTGLCRHHREQLLSTPLAKCSSNVHARSFATTLHSTAESRDLENELTLKEIEKDGAKIAELQMCRPHARNPLSRNLLLRLRNYVDHLKFDKGVRVVILRSLVPGAFCAGADLKERHAMTNAEVMQHTIRQRAILTEMEKLPMPIIAAIDGYALGGGLELALACDLRVASTSAKLGLVETRLGIIPGAGGTARLPRVVGIAKAKELIYTARVLHGKQAEKIGLVNEVVEQNESGDAAYLKTLELAYEILANGPIGVRMGKLSLSRGSEVDLATALSIEEMCYAQVVPTKDRIEGLLAFKEKRKPQYTGE